MLPILASFGMLLASIGSLTTVVTTQLASTATAFSYSFINFSQKHF